MAGSNHTPSPPEFLQVGSPSPPRAALPGVELLFLEVQKRGVKTPTAHLLFYSPKPSTAAQAEPAQGAEGDTAWVPPERRMLGAASSGWPRAQHCLSAPGRRCCRPTQALSREPLGHLTLCFPRRGRTWLQPPTRTAQCTRTPSGPQACAPPCSGAAPSQPPGAAPGEGRIPAYPPPGLALPGTQ